ncbi:MAG: hypothetical protein ACE5JH_05590 [Acidobacteriota bacterium]
MMKPKSSRLTVAILAVAALIVAAGGTAVASNMAFKLNKAIVFSGTGQIGNNWTSLPFNNPYTNGQSLCDQLGLVGNASLSVLDGTTGTFTSGICGSTAVGVPITAGQGVLIRQPADAGAPSSVIIVGSHNPTLSLSIPAVVPGGGPNQGNLWFAVPYHTTAVTAEDLCNSTGMTPLVGSITRLDAAAGNFVSCVCGATCPGVNLVLGEHVQLRNGDAGLANIGIAHF